MADMTRETLLAELEFLAREARRVGIIDYEHSELVTKQMIEMTIIAGTLDLVRALIIAGEGKELFEWLMEFGNTKIEILKIIDETKL